MIIHEIRKDFLRLKKKKMMIRLIDLPSLNLERFYDEADHAPNHSKVADLVHFS